MSDGPRSYGRMYEAVVSHRVRKRLGYDKRGSAILRFVVQLEYFVEDEWLTVVRYDHDATGSFGHDVSEDGIHIDHYRDGQKYRTEYVAPAMPAKLALDRAEDHLANNLDTFIRRFERWHEITPDR